MGQPGMKFRPEDTKNSYRGLETHKKNSESDWSERCTTKIFYPCRDGLNWG
jgi:hypothetical protein